MRETGAILGVHGRQINQKTPRLAVAQASDLQIVYV
jgi:hypothetical protein